MYFLLVWLPQIRTKFPWHFVKHGSTSVDGFIINGRMSTEHIPRGTWASSVQPIGSPGRSPLRRRPNVLTHRKDRSLRFASLLGSLHVPGFLPLILYSSLHDRPSTLIFVQPNTWNMCAALMNIAPSQTRALGGHRPPRVWADPSFELVKTF